MEEPKKDLTIKQVKSSLALMFRFIFSDRKKTILLTLLSFISALAASALPYIGGKILDTIISRESFEFIGEQFYLFILFLLAWLVVQMISGIADWKKQNEQKTFAAESRAHFIVHIYNHLFKLPLSFHSKYKIGEVNQKVSQLAMRIERLTEIFLIEVGPQLLTLFIALFIMFYMNVLLTLIVLLGVLLYSYTLYRSVQPTAAIQKSVHRFWSASFGNAVDAVGNIKTIKSLAMEEDETERLRYSFFEKAMPPWAALTRIWANLSGYQKIAVVGSQLLIYGLSIYFIFQGTMTIGELVAFVGYTELAFTPFMRLGTAWQHVQNAIVEAQEVKNDFLDHPTEIYSRDSHKIIQNLKGDIEFREVRFSYAEGNEVLKGITFRASSGEKIALVGESGQGKSTLIDLLSAFTFPASGEVLIDGVRTDKLSLHFLRSHIGIVPQEVVLFNDTIENNLKYGVPNATRKDLEEAARKADALGFIENFPNKWEQEVGERGIKLSVGQKQRIAIARAILRDPAILILDEPTSALDAKSEHAITESLKELMQGRTSFVIAHRLSTVRQADKILVLHDGQIVEQGTHHELIQKEGGKYRELYELQIGLHE